MRECEGCRGKEVEWVQQEKENRKGGTTEDDLYMLTRAIRSENQGDFKGDNIEPFLTMPRINGEIASGFPN